MNLVLGILLMGLTRVALIAHSRSVALECLRMADLSLILCFFNLLPIPPLDGSQILRVVTGMTYEAYYQMARYGFIILIVVLQIPMVRFILGAITTRSEIIIGSWFGLPIGL
jgi:Zn-dependent protease